MIQRDNRLTDAQCIQRIDGDIVQLIWLRFRFGLGLILEQSCKLEDYLHSEERANEVWL